MELVGRGPQPVCITPRQLPGHWKRVLSARKGSSERKWEIDFFVVLVILKNTPKGNPVTPPNSCNVVSTSSIPLADSLHVAVAETSYIGGRGGWLGASGCGVGRYLGGHCVAAEQRSAEGHPGKLSDDPCPFMVMYAVQVLSVRKVPGAGEIALVALLQFRSQHCMGP